MTLSLTLGSAQAFHVKSDSLIEAETAIEQRELSPIDNTLLVRQSPPAIQRAVVVHAGARDSYQLALGLAESGLLQMLVTDFFWSKDSGWVRYFHRLLPSGVQRKLMLRSAPALNGNYISVCLEAALGGLLLDKASFIPFEWRGWLTRKADKQLGIAAGKLAKQTGTYLVSYSYYGFDGFQALGRADMLFQMHPHPATMRRLLEDEMERHPESAKSLKLEWELALPESDFEHLVSETHMARCFLVASSFTRDTLIEHGADPLSIHVVPYGVDLSFFHPGVRPEATTSNPLRLLFVGRINQRKGLRYLLEALKEFAPYEVELTICGRILDEVDDLKNHPFPIVVRPSVSASELALAYQHADLFVLPSIAEGFGQVLLEALASGLPILSTTRTAAPDLIEDGVQGFIVKPQRSDLLAERIRWGVEHRQELRRMGILARERAETFTWSRFRRGVAEAVADFMATDSLHRESR